MMTVRYGKQIHTLYESNEEAARNGIVPKLYWEANEGDYVVAENGIIVQLLKKQEVTSYKRRIGKKYYDRPKPHLYYIYTFPCCKFIYRPKDDITAPPKKFYYKRKLGTLQDIYEQTGTLLTPRKMYFALLLANGFPPDVAIQMAHQNKKKRELRARMFEYMTCPQTIYYFTYVAMNMGTLKQELEKRGITTETMADRIVRLMDDKEAPANIRKFALEVGIRALEEGTQQSVNPSYLPQGVDIIAIRERLQLKAAEIQQ